MVETDKDIEELERALGPSRADYQTLRHHRPLLPIQAKPPQRQWRHAIAASVLLAVTAITFLAIDLTGKPNPLPNSPSRLAISRPAAIPLSLRPAGGIGAGLSSSRSELAIKFRFPKRPTGSNG